MREFGWEPPTAPVRRESCLWRRGVRHTPHLQRQSGHSSVTQPGRQVCSREFYLGRVRGIKGAQRQSHHCPLLGPMCVAPSSGTRESGAKKGGGVGLGAAVGSSDSLPGEPPTSEPLSRRAASQEHTVLFVGAEICSMLIMQAGKAGLSLFLSLSLSFSLSL